jgi:hypothetical protein
MEAEGEGEGEVGMRVGFAMFLNGGRRRRLLVLLR